MSPETAEPFRYDSAASSEEDEPTPWSWGLGLLLHVEQVHGCTHTSEARAFFGLLPRVGATTVEEGAPE